MIPKRIIQTGPKKLPLLFESALVNVRLLHPDFEYLFFDDTMIEDFLRTQFPEYISEYYSFPFRIQRYDLFRYLAAYHYGGFYLDVDVFLARDLSPLVSSQCVFSFEELAETPYSWKHFRMDWQIGNYAFGSEPAHPFFAAVIENCLRGSRDPAWVKPMMKGTPPTLRNDFYVLNTTGPGMLSRTFAENPQLTGGIDILFPEDVRDPATWHQFGTYGVHNMAGSWRERAPFLSRCLTRLWERWNMHRMLSEAGPRGKTRTVQVGPIVDAIAGLATSSPSETRIC